MKSSHWKTYAVVCAASLLAVGCSKDAESKPLEREDRAAPVAAAEPAPAEATPEAPEIAPVVMPVEGSSLIPAAPAPAPAVAKAEKAIAAPRGAKARPMSSGAVIKKQYYDLTIEVAPVASGAEGSIKFTLVPKGGRHINLEFPTKLVVTPPAGVTVAKPKLAKSDAVTFSEKKAVFDVKFKATGAGDKAFTGKFKFAVCTESTCDPQTEKLAFNVAVK